jgi:hypothetical protein
VVGACQAWQIQFHPLDQPGQGRMANLLGDVGEQVEALADVGLIGRGDDQHDRKRRLRQVVLAPVPSNRPVVPNAFANSVSLRQLACDADHPSTFPAIWPLTS